MNDVDNRYYAPNNKKFGQTLPQVVTMGIDFKLKYTYISLTNW